ncbi:hippurate hydrolase [Endobacter medicaginis]|uniref:Amidohydrolase n=1 Tax=Endobacter medicaginis TaxID=1181271 RepID=A0A839UX55_9PROT|nr:amidohydrolase [Endobacter medicaginis]MBB3174356.1 hippurate hydrolase [Endobacter medicaginis]MCX5476700.1 amidohydrolase [Endobacter medicaginis]NVN30945.1 amidohydrolase [Endobacter medicaginis]
MRRMTLLMAALAGAPALGRAEVPAASFDAAAAKARIDAELDRDYPALEALYKDIHQHPEIGFQEVRTAALLAERMRRLGFTVTEHVGRTGIVAIYRNGPGPVVLVRTELDALPLEEKTGLAYASHAQQSVDGKLTPVAHACGHDSHMAWWVGTAEALLAMKDQWHGTLMFVGQPAEEIISGAKAMLDDGLFTRFPRPDFGFAAHVGPAPIGQITVKQGVTSSATDTLLVTFHGVGAHGSMPDKSIDPIVEGAHFVDDVQTVISRQKDPQKFGVITVGSFNAGTVANIIPDHADLQLTLRSFDPDVRKLLTDGVATTAKAVADMAHAPAPEVKHAFGAGSVINDPDLSASAAGMLKTALGAGHVTLVPATLPGISASEDYSEFVAAGMAKSVYFGIGGYDPKTIAQYKAEGRPLPVNHSPYFAPVPEPTIRTGVETLTLAVLMVAHDGGR